MTSRFQPSTIKNKIKRESVAAKNKKAKNQQKLQKRLAQAKVEANDPAAKKVPQKLLTSKTMLK
jgi:ribosome production factor 1